MKPQTTKDILKEIETQLDLIGWKESNILREELSNSITRLISSNDEKWKQKIEERIERIIKERKHRSSLVGVNEFLRELKISLLNDNDKTIRKESISNRSNDKGCGTVLWDKITKEHVYLCGGKKGLCEVCKAKENKSSDVYIERAEPLTKEGIKVICMSDEDYEKYKNECSNPTMEDPNFRGLPDTTKKGSDLKTSLLKDETEKTNGN